MKITVSLLDKLRACEDRVAWIVYDAARAQARTTYEAECAQARTAYFAACASALATYEAARAQAFCTAANGKHGTKEESDAK